MTRKKKVEAWTTYKDGEKTEAEVTHYVGVARIHGYITSDNSLYRKNEIKKADLYECPHCESLHEDAEDAASCCDSD